VARSGGRAASTLSVCVLPFSNPSAEREQDYFSDGITEDIIVTHTLEGSVRKAGQRLCISAQLIDAAQDRPVRADRYDRDLSDIFALQTEISEAIVAALARRETA
jgi:adenylate cyclase